MLDGELQNFRLFQFAAVRIPRRCGYQSSQLAKGRVYSVATFLLDHPPPPLSRRVLTGIASRRVATVSGKGNKERG